MDVNKHIRKISNYGMVGGLGVVVMATLQGCGDDPATHQTQQPQSQIQQQNIVKEGATVTIKESLNTENNTTSYKIIDEVPSVTSRVILVDVKGNEKILSKEEIDKLVKEEEGKVDAGTSNLTKPPEEVASSGGMGLAGTLMASMAAGMLGAALMNKLSGNKNYEQNRRTSYSSPQGYSRSQNSFSKARTANSAAKARSSSPKKSGFFSNKKSSSTRSSSFGG